MTPLFTTFLLGIGCASCLHVPSSETWPSWGDPPDPHHYNEHMAKLVRKRTKIDVDRVRTVSNTNYIIKNGMLHGSTKRPKNEAKLKAMENMIASVLDRAKRAGMDISEAAFDLEESPLGTNISDRPILSIARSTSQEKTGGILIPNPYFGILPKWEQDIKTFERKGITSWQKKTEKVFWKGSLDYLPRGHSACRHKAECLGPGLKDRVEAASFTTKSPDMFDIKVIKVSPDWTHSCSDHSANIALELGGRVEQYSYSKYKYLANLPGNSCGGYSRNLNHLWFMGSVVIQWECEPDKGVDWEEWYYPALETNVTHVLMNRDNAEKVVADLRAHDERAKAIAAKSIQVADTFLRGQSFVEHFLYIFKRLGKKMTSDSRVLAEPGHWEIIQEDPDFVLEME